MPLLVAYLLQWCSCNFILLYIIIDLSINVGINRNHDIGDHVLSDFKKSINKVFETKYIDDFRYKIKQEVMKNEAEYHKKQDKKIKEFMKLQNKK